MPAWEGLQTSFIWQVFPSRALLHSAICWPLLEMPAVQKVERKLLVRGSHSFPSTEIVLHTYYVPAFAFDHIPAPKEFILLNTYFSNWR